MKTKETILKNFFKLESLSTVDPITKIKKTVNPITVIKKYAREIPLKSLHYNYSLSGLYVYFFNIDGDWYLKDTFCNLPPDLKHLTSTTYKMSIHNYYALNHEVDIKIDVKSEFSQAALSLGLGDGLWQAFIYLINGHPTLLNEANFFLPFIIGPIVGFVHYYLQVNQFKSRQGRVPVNRVYQQFKKDSAALSIRMSLGMLGWEAGLFIATALLTDMKPKTASYIIIAGLFTGLAQALGSLSASISTEIIGKGKVNSSKFEVGVFFIASFFAGAAWYYLGNIDYTPHLTGNEKKILSAFLGGLFTFISTTATYMLTNPANNLSSLFLCCSRCCSTPQSPTQHHNYYH